MMRPSPRPIFLEAQRRLNVRFYTSNLSKYLQAKLVFESFGLTLHHFRSRTEPYSESYDYGKDSLLTSAVDQIKSDIGRSSLFFIEDTSLRIEALSTSDADFPGLAVKEWFSSTSFEALDSQLPQDPLLRRATVKSDIALHVPGLADPVFFHGETNGHIAATPPDFDENPHHPWLTPKSFNGWLIPDGAFRRLGEMSWEESWDYDFRVRSLIALVQRLEEYAALLNAPPECYVTLPHRTQLVRQPNLFNNESRTLIVVGKTCAGKTTFGQIASRIGDAKVVEASDVVRSFRRLKDTHLSPLTFAKRLLEEHGADLVARKIIDMYRLEEGGDFIITGFRTTEELEAVRKVRRRAQVVLIESTDRTRYSRHLKRGREPAMSFNDFLAHDRAQWSFGLLRVAEDFANIRIINEGAIEEYERQITSVLANPENPDALGVTVNVSPRHELSIHRLYRCLSILERNARAMSCDEIEDITAREEEIKGDPQGSRYTGKRITQNNVNKVLKTVPELARRIETGQARVQYKITDSGRAYLRLMEVYSKEDRR
jgi:dephospho-CoA kinase